MTGDRFIPEEAVAAEGKNRRTDKKFLSYCEKMVDFFCHDFSVDGSEALAEFKKANPDAKFVVMASHTNNLDAPAAVKALGGHFDMLLTGESLLLEKLKYLPQRAMINLMGKENFFPLDYISGQGKKHGSFNPENFEGLDEKISSGKTPWIAGHPFSRAGQMKKASIGPVYLAQKSGAYIVPCGLETHGGSDSMGGIKEQTKGMAKRSDTSAKFHVGEPVKLPYIDINIIEKVFHKRKNGEKVSEEEKTVFSETVSALRSQAESLNSSIANMLPEKQRGVYGKEINDNQILSDIIMDKEKYIPEEARKEKEDVREAGEKPADVRETASIDYKAEEEKTGEKTRQVRKKIDSLNTSSLPATWNLAEKRIVLPEEEQAALNTAAESIKKADRFAAPALFKGNRTATEYDSKACNFSTQTNIVELPDGRKIFVVHNYKSTGLHRWMDGTMKHLTGYPMRKATRVEWKGRFEEKSNLPTIPLDDPEMVALPFVPNVNLDDLFCRQQEIEDFGECNDFAKDYTEEDKLAVLEKIAGKIKELHGKDVAWGELILANIIIDKKQDVHICDPEVAYDEGVPMEEQKAYDLLDLITSACTSMEDGHKTSYDKVVGSILKNYEDPEALASLKKLAEKKLGFKEKLFFGYSKARLRLKSPKQFEEIKGAILAHLS